MILRADRESEEDREVAEDVPVLELLKLAPAVDEPADDGVALMVGVVLGDGVDQIRGQRLGTKSGLAMAAL